MKFDKGNESSCLVLDFQHPNALAITPRSAGEQAGVAGDLETGSSGI